ncbi:MAG: undecaprenyldiphospho-muramoylpentapeptide beta-N-acetylglucosaminyltransferase [Chloroflexi bacterium B3_Chlor]|nr:MAG: undecaprenyldiphospho-muramoylpentapeptide beta-N-acetylglucosaminyltransferase [Chloroflexi bacterium B3_Chlor]
MRLLVSGGGTGGHVYPILAVLQQLISKVTSPSEVCYVGNASGIEADLAARAGLPFQGISTASLQGSAPWALPARLTRLARGTAQSVRLIDRFSPQAVLATGGYVCAPTIVAAWIRGVPSLVYLPDLTPGLAIRVLARFATRIAVSFPPSKSFFGPGKAVVTGYPVRAELLKADRFSSRRRLGLDELERTLLVFGGSQGAHSINVALSEALDELLEICQVVHISGDADTSWLSARRDALPQAVVKRYSVYPYLHEKMIDALAAADLVVARAGAATTAEFPALGLPSILIPYPYAGRHQELNANYMVESGAAVKIAEADLEKGVLSKTVAELFEDQQELARLGDGARRLAQPSAAPRVAQLLTDIARPNCLTH